MYRSLLHISLFIQSPWSIHDQNGLFLTDNFYGYFSAFNLFTGYFLCWSFVYCSFKTQSDGQFSPTFNQRERLQIENEISSLMKLNFTPRRKCFEWFFLCFQSPCTEKKYILYSPETCNGGSVSPLLGFYISICSYSVHVQPWMVIIQVLTVAQVA